MPARKKPRVGRVQKNSGAKRNKTVTTELKSQQDVLSITMPPQKKVKQQAAGTVHSATSGIRVAKSAGAVLSTTSGIRVAKSTGAVLSTTSGIRVAKSAGAVLSATSGIQVAKSASKVQLATSGIQVAKSAGTVQLATSGIQLAQPAHNIQLATSGIHEAKSAGTLQLAISGIQVAQHAHKVKLATSGIQVANSAGKVQLATSGIHEAKSAGTVQLATSGIQVAQPACKVQLATSGIQVAKSAGTVQFATSGIQVARSARKVQLATSGIQVAKSADRVQLATSGIQVAKSAGKVQLATSGIKVAQPAGKVQLATSGIQVARSAGTVQLGTSGIQLASSAGTVQLATSGIQVAPSAKSMSVLVDNSKTPASQWPVVSGAAPANVLVASQGGVEGAALVMTPRVPAGAISILNYGGNGTARLYYQGDLFNPVVPKAAAGASAVLVNTQQGTQIIGQVIPQIIIPAQQQPLLPHIEPQVQPQLLKQQQQQVRALMKQGRATVIVAKPPVIQKPDVKRIMPAATLLSELSQQDKTITSEAAKSPMSRAMIKKMKKREEHDRSNRNCPVVRNTNQGKQVMLMLQDDSVYRTETCRKVLNNIVSKVVRKEIHKERVRKKAEKRKLVSAKKRQLMLFKHKEALKTEIQKKIFLNRKKLKLEIQNEIEEIVKKHGSSLKKTVPDKTVAAMLQMKREVQQQQQQKQQQQELPPTPSPVVQENARNTVNNMSYVLTNPTSSDSDHAYSILSGCIKPNEPTPDYMRKFDDIICDFLREQGVPGASLFISFHGKPIYKQGYGINCCGELVSSSSHFRIASISKVLTAIAVLRLCEEGQLTLSDKVFGIYGILDRFKTTNVTRMKQYERITVQDLLQHSAGWDRDLVGDHVFWYTKNEHRSKIDVWNNETLVEYVLSHNLSFKTGSRHAYSNLGYLVLGLVIEEVTGMPYEDYVKTVLRTLDIEDIYVGKTKQDTVHYEEIKYYNNKDPSIERSVFGENNVVAPQYGSFPMENTGAFGGWVTSAQNLVTVLDSLIMMNEMPSALSAQSVSAMLKAPRYAEEEDWYGLGLDVEDNGASFGHTGAMEGTSTTVHHDKTGLTWAFLLNSWAKDMDLDGLIKYALSSVQGLPFWSGIDFRCGLEENFVMSADEVECVSILSPHKRLITDVIDMKTRGYAISRVNAISMSGDVKFNIIWRKQPEEQGEWSLMIDIKLHDFDKCLKKMKGNWEVTSLESYVMNGVVYHLFVFRERKYSQQKVYVVDSMVKHREFKKTYEACTYRLQTQSILEVDDHVIISAVYNRVLKVFSPSEIWLDVSMEDFVNKLAKCIEDGLLLSYLQFYTTKDMPKISAVWHQNSEQNNVFQRHDVTKYGFLFELGESMKCNRPVSFISAYMYEDVTYFMAVWETEVRTGKNFVFSKT